MYGIPVLCVGIPIRFFPLNGDAVYDAAVI